MRKNQLSMTAERFGDQAADGHREKFLIYSDGNEFAAVIARALEKLRCEYYPQLDREGFYAMLAEQDTASPFMGLCESHFFGGSRNTDGS